MACVFERVARENIGIVEIDFEVVRIREVCTNARRQFTNTCWVEPETGFIWKSQQWPGANLEQATIEIIRPYAGRVFSGHQARCQARQGHRTVFTKLVSAHWPVL